MNTREQKMINLNKNYIYNNRLQYNHESLTLVSDSLSFYLIIQNVNKKNCN